MQEGAKVCRFLWDHGTHLTQGPPQDLTWGPPEELTLAQEGVKVCRFFWDKGTLHLLAWGGFSKEVRSEFGMMLARQRVLDEEGGRGKVGDADREKWAGDLAEEGGGVERGAGAGGRETQPHERVGDLAGEEGGRGAGGRGTQPDETAERGGGAAGAAVIPTVQASLGCRVVRGGVQGSRSTMGRAPAHDTVSQGCLAHQKQPPPRTLR